MAYNPKGGKKNFLIEFTNVTNEEQKNIVQFIKVVLKLKIFSFKDFLKILLHCLKKCKTLYCLVGLCCLSN